MKIFKKYFNCQVKNGNVFDKNTKTFKNIKKYSKIFSESEEMLPRTEKLRHSKKKSTKFLLK